MLTQKEVAALIDILATGSSLEVAAAAFQRAFVRADHFRVAAAVCMMLEDNLLPVKERATALYIVHDLYKSEAPAAQPFLPFLVQLLQPSSPCELHLHERNLLCLLLAQPPDKDVGKKTPAQLEGMWVNGEEQALPNLVSSAADERFLSMSLLLCRPFASVTWRARCSSTGAAEGSLCREGRAGARDAAYRNQRHAP